MAKQTKQQKIDELRDVLKQIYKKTRYGLMAQINRADRNPRLVGARVGQTIMDICKEHMSST